ncbi:MAG: alpha/beta hydrolase [Solirubrobacteraceae bacterium]
MVRERTIETSVETGRHAGLAYALWLPDDPPVGAALILHGAGSCKESHFDFGRAARDMGLAALAFDQRGHGESDGPMGAEAVDDVVAMAALLRGRAGAALPPDRAVPLALRGSSMGGYMALVSAAPAAASAVVAICPAGSEHLLRGLREGRFEFEADLPALERLLAANDVEAAVADLTCPLLLLHAEGDEQIPVDHSRALYEAAGPERARLLVMPGGHHRSIQHDGELQGESLRFVRRAFAQQSG